jgi:hypothetical protein
LLSRYTRRRSTKFDVDNERNLWWLPPRQIEHRSQ